MAFDPLLSRISDYPTAVLSWVAPDGYPSSVRCRAEFDPGAGVIVLHGLGAAAVGARGAACLLFHRHDEHLEGLHQMVVRGTLVDGPSAPGGGVFRIDRVVTANGRSDTDAMPHASAPLHMLAFYRSGRSAAALYLRRRGAPWPPIPFEEIRRKVAKHG
jgi:hypothetical protein